MKSYLTFLILSLISHNKAINYPGFKVFKPKHDHGNGEMDWEGVSIYMHFRYRTPFLLSKLRSQKLCPLAILMLLDENPYIVPHL